MPGMSCVVPGCHQRFVNSKLQNSTKISFHKIPKNIDVRKVWVGRCLNQSILQDRYNSRVCSDHFSQDDYETDLKSELLGVISRPRLKKFALPSLKLPFYKPLIKPEVDQPISTEVEKRKKIVEELLNCPTDSSASPGIRIDKLTNSTKISKQDGSHPDPINTAVSQTNLRVSESTIPRVKMPPISNASINSIIAPANGGKIVRDVNGLTNKAVVKSYEEFRSEVQIAEIAKLRGLLEKRTKQITKTKKQYSEVRKKLLQKSRLIVNAEHNLTAAKLQIKRMKRQLEAITKKKKQKDLLKEKSCEILKKIFTATQIKMLMGKKKVKWAEEDFANAFALRYISKRAYLFVRDRLSYPLPVLSTLRRYAAAAITNRGKVADEHARDVYESELKAGVIQLDDDDDDDSNSNDTEMGEILNTENDDVTSDNICG